MKIIERMNKDSLPVYGKYLFLVVCIWLLSFEEPVTKLHIPVITIFRNLLPLAAVVFFLAGSFQARSETQVPDDAVKWPEMHERANPRFTMLTDPFAICGLVFAFAGMAGWFINMYQSFNLSVQAMFEHLRFWVLIWFFMYLLIQIPWDRYAKKLFFHVGLLSTAFIILGIVDEIFKIWPRQIYRLGIGSIQLFFSHPSNLGGHCVFLLGLLCLLWPWLRSDDDRQTNTSNKCLILIAGMLFLICATLRVRLLGFAALFILLYVFMIVLRLRPRFWMLLAGTALALVIGWQRLYFYYFSPEAYTMARGQFAVNSLDIAAKNLPFGGGFGSFGSRIAQIHYSPLYYNYHMMTTPGMTPKRPSYACDTFFPMILGESGWLGMVAYLGMILLLVLLIFRVQNKGFSAITIDTKDGPVKRLIILSSTFTSLMMVAFELAESTGTLAFSETYSVIISIVIGMALAQATALTSHDLKM